MSESGSGKSGGKKSSSKLGHDPLAWIDPAEAVADEIESKPVPKTEPIEIETGSSHKKPKQASKSVSNPVVLKLPAYFNISQVTSVYQELQNLLNDGCSQVDIAGDEVEAIDGAAVQLLLVFFKDAGASDIKITWSSKSQKIIDVVSMLGIADMVGLSA